MSPPLGRSARCVLLLAALSAVTLGCAQPVPPAPPEPAPGGAGGAEPSPSAEEERRMVWGDGWRVTVRPVFSGSAVQNATGTVTVEEWAGGPGRVRYEFPRMVLGSIRPEVASRSVGLLRPEPAAGTIVVPIAVRSRAIFTPPALWPGGDAHAPGPLLWLPLGALTALRERSEVEIELEPLPNGLRMETAPGASGPVKLRLAGEGEAVLRVGGKPTRFPVVRLTDDHGSTYTLLNSSQNPLVIRFRFGPSASVAGRKLVTGAQSGYDVVALDGPE